MSENHDPNNLLKQSPIEFTGPKGIPIGEKLKKVLLYLGIAILVTIVALVVQRISIILALSMPAAFGLAVYAVWLRYKVVMAEENKLPDLSKIEVPPPTPDEPEKKDDEPTSGITYS